MPDKKVLILGSQHGDELSGERLYRHIRRSHPNIYDCIKFMLGNPKARKLGTRFVESDMNRSYTGARDTYEQRRAMKILEMIEREGYDLVLDLHTTTVEQPPCLILEEINGLTEPFIHASSFEHIVVMGNAIANNALVGACKQAVAIEIYREIGLDLLESICWDIERYLNNVPSDHTKNVYRDIHPIRKSEVSSDDIRRLRNFELSEFGHYPIMVGERAYENHTDYIGFKAYKRYKFKV